jgi:hypothetical protein
MRYNIFSWRLRGSHRVGGSENPEAKATEWSCETHLARLMSSPKAGKL